MLSIILVASIAVAVGVDHDISVADFFDDLQIVCEIALIFSVAHVLCVTALQDDVVILHEAELVFMAHSHDPPLRMGDHDIFDSEVAGCLDDGKDLIRCDMGSSKDCIVIADKFQYRAQFRNDLSVFYDFHALAQILAHFLHVIFCGLCREPDNFCSKTKCGIDGFRIDPAYNAV